MTKNFKRSEFMCKCGCGLVNISRTLVHMLQRARDIFGMPMNITSGCRCEKHNRNVGGVADSDHITSETKEGQAADISYKNGKELFLLISALLTVGFVRIGINFKHKFVHVDISKTKYQPTIFSY